MTQNRVVVLLALSDENGNKPEADEKAEAEHETLRRIYIEYKV